MDIIVTTPKSRMADAAQEAREAREAIEAGGESWYFRNLGRADREKGAGETICQQRNH